MKNSSDLLGLIDPLLSKYNQIVIFGGAGWLGKSTLDVLLSLNNKDLRRRLLIIGSGNGSIRMQNFELPVYSMTGAHSKLRKGSLLFNYAFLRREKEKLLGREQYLMANENIMSYSESLVSHDFVKTFINSSSGAATTAESGINFIDSYSTLKFQAENRNRELCLAHDVEYINCRIYNMTGIYINEFENLAISNFVRQASTCGTIEVKSPLSIRTYVDAMDLSLLLIKLAAEGESRSFDSGGFPASMLEIAELVAKFFKIESVQRSEQPRSDYIGDFLWFNKFAKEAGVELTNIEHQVLGTIKAITEH